MTQPRLLDLFCCQGGAGAGYVAAGFDVFGIDIEPQDRNPHPMIVGDAMFSLADLLVGIPLTFNNGQTLGLADFSAIHASPPCQGYSNAQRIQGRSHALLIPALRGLLKVTKLPYVIENVPGAPLVDPVTLCGSMFGLRLYRHRLFESNFPLAAPPHPAHLAPQVKMGRKPKAHEMLQPVGNFSGVAEAREAMGMPWASRDGLREAIPPAYTEFIGGYLLAAVTATRLDVAA